MARKDAKELTDFLLSIGFTEARRTRQGGSVYRHPDYPRNVTVLDTIPDHSAGHLIENISKVFGIETKQGRSKRDAKKAKARLLEDRARAAENIERSKRELEAAWAELDSRLAGLGRGLTAGQITAIERRIEQHEVQVRYWQSVMTTVDGALPHQRVKHRS